jgi:D-galactonate transporter
MARAGSRIAKRLETTAMSTTTLGTSGHAAVAQSAADGVYRKVTWRLLPLLFVCYIAAYLDRVNVGFAKLGMQSDLPLSDSIYGLGAGIFFVGYFIFEVPSNIILHRVGAGRWIARIMVSWGVISAATMFVNSVASFYIARFLLGVAEAGFFPGIILYLTYWFPAERRGRATSLFLTAIAVASIIGGPTSGWILHSMGGVNGWKGWQWLFLLEAIPSLVLGVVAWFYLEDRVTNAHWLTPAERELIARDILAEESHKLDDPLRKVVANPKVWISALVYFGIASGLYGVSFWLPTIIKAMGVQDPLDVGLISAIPWCFGVVAMYLVAASADRRREARWHTAVMCVVGAIGLVISVMASGSVTVAMIGLTLGTIGIMSALPVSWSTPTSILGGAAAAAGIAMINSIGNLAGFLIPFAIGVIKDATHSTDLGLYMLAALMVIGGLAELALPKRGKPGA